MASESSEQFAMSSQPPNNFSWVIEGLLAGCAFPFQEGHFQFLVDSGIQHLVTLTEDTPPMNLIPTNLRFHHIPVVDYHAPSIQQLLDVCNILKEAKLAKEGVAVHCLMGRGRTGTVLAACLVALQSPKPEDAIIEIRKKRPYSIETSEQEKAIHAFSELVLSRNMLP